MDVIHKGQRLYLVFEFIDHDMKYVLDHTEGMVDMMQVKIWVYQMFAGIHFCHSRRILHRGSFVIPNFFTKIKTVHLLTFSSSLPQTSNPKTFSSIDPTR